jgi:hypothetical protein
MRMSRFVRALLVFLLVAASSHAGARSATLPDGTRLVLALSERLDSEVAQAGQPFALTVAEDVRVDGAVVVPKGAGARGTVLFTRKVGSARSGALDLRIDHVDTPAGPLRVRASLSRRSSYLAAEHAADYALMGLGFSVRREEGEAIVLEPGALIDVEAVGASGAAVNASARPSWLSDAGPDEGLVVIFRERRFYGSANAIQVYADDGVALPKVRNGQFVQHALAAGDHRLYRDRKRRDLRIVGIAPGEVLFFEARFEAKASIGADVDLVPVEYAEGVQRVEALLAGAKRD